jgi:hypothetical protein
MSPNEIDALRNLIAKARAELRKKRRRAPIIAKVYELRAEIRLEQSLKRDAVLMLELAGSLEGLCYA